MDDPIKTNDFIKKIIIDNKRNVKGVAIISGGRLTLGKNKSKIEYLLSLLLIMGLFSFFKKVLKTLSYNFSKILDKLNLYKSNSLENFVVDQNINLFKLKNPNSKDFISYLKKEKVDLIINQSMTILKKDILSIPKIGIINRHNALVPKNRGRLSPFWVKYKNEKETGVTIHFLNEKIDEGDIIVQKKFTLKSSYNFNSIVEKNYELAQIAMQEAIDLLKKYGKKVKTIRNNKLNGSYNSTPRLKEAFLYRIKLFKKIF